MRRYVIGWALALTWTVGASAATALLHLPKGVETSYFVGFVAACLYCWAVT